LGYDGGLLSCDDSCNYETINCFDGEPPEECDMGNFRGLDCPDIGDYEAGYLVCNTDCTIDESMCTKPSAKRKILNIYVENICALLE
jgi:hypothetical protein